jgi:hypothetical protein
MRGWPPPGSPLVKGEDAGGLRWFLDGKPVHAMTFLELCLETRSEPCPTCSGIDWPIERDCSTCGNLRRLAEYGWMLVRLEFDPFQQQALAYLPTAGTWDMYAIVREGAHFRWPR